MYIGFRESKSGLILQDERSKCISGNFSAFSRCSKCFLVLSQDSHAIEINNDSINLIN